MIALNGDNDGSVADPAPIVTTDNTKRDDPTKKPDGPKKTQRPSPTTSAPPVVGKPDETTSPAPTSEAPTSEVPTSEPPTSEPPTSEPPPPPPPPPPPASDAQLAPLSVETQGALYFLTVDVSGVPAGGEATLQVTWSQLALHKRPDNCALSPQKNAVLCPVTDSTSKVVGIEFDGKALDIVPRIRATLIPRNFEETDPTNNIREWHKLLGLLGVLV
jgi:hypothetical protein